MFLWYSELAGGSEAKKTYNPITGLSKLGRVLAKQFDLPAYFMITGDLPLNEINRVL